MKRRYVTTLVIESDLDPSGWPLGQFALEVTLGRADRGEGSRVRDRGPKPACDCAFGRWMAEQWGEWVVMTLFGLPSDGPRTVSASCREGAVRFSGPICEVCAKVR